MDAFVLWIPGHDEPVRLELAGEIAQVFLPGGYTWAEYGHSVEDMREALIGVLAFVDAYAHPSTRKVEARRRFRRTRTELRVSNGAVLRLRGWSQGPDQGDA